MTDPTDRVPRTVSEVQPQRSPADQTTRKTLAGYRSAPAYVLLGDAGAGKSTEFTREHSELGETAQLITARDFLRSPVAEHPEWRRQTLFIDGLDERRADGGDVRAAIDRIYEKLEEIGRPSFRISCREADWLGQNDRNSLAQVAPDGALTVLRLDPLTDRQAESIIRASGYTGDAEEFIANARERGIDALLANPQSLLMLIEVVAAEGDWPESRLETFERACNQIVRGHNAHNEEHRLARRTTAPDPAQLVDASGRLCAIALMSGAAGYALPPAAADDEYLDLQRCAFDTHQLPQDALPQDALGTNLFRAGPSEAQRMPVHRHIAEFLAARYLAQLIERGLPVRRVLALLTGHDGSVVTPLRGLSAWLAAHSRPARAELIDRDPIGVGLYGDIHDVSTDEKRRLLTSLTGVITKLWLGPTTASAFSPLAVPDLEPVFRQILGDRCRSKEHQLLAEFVLRVLSAGGPLSGVARVALRIVRDETWRPQVQVRALDAFIHTCVDPTCRTDTLKELLNEVHAGHLADPHDDLRGTLLTSLYPAELSPADVWDYLPQEPAGRCRRFYEVTVPEQSTDQQIRDLLDQLVARYNGEQGELHYAGNVPRKLLARGLNAYGDESAAARLCDWFTAAWWVSRDRLDYADGAIDQVTEWLRQRPTLSTKILEEGLNRCPEDDTVWGCARDAEFSLMASLPPDWGRWCLEQAVVLANTKPRRSHYLLSRAVQAWRDKHYGKGLTLALLRERTRDSALLSGQLAELLDQFPARKCRTPRSRDDPSYLEEDRERHTQWLDRVRPLQEELRSNRAPPAFLHDIGRAYFGMLPGQARSATAGERLRWLFDDDDRLCSAGLEALRGTLTRDDLPEVADIIRLREESRVHHLSYPFLAGMTELHSETPAELDELNERQMRTAIALYFCVSVREADGWYRRLVDRSPKLVADVLVQSATSALKGGGALVSRFYELAHDADHRHVARHACLRLLKRFPVRCNEGQLKALDYLLWAALQHADGAELQDLIDGKLSRSSMTVAQRVHWLAAGLVTTPDRYSSLLEDSVRHNSPALRNLQHFFPLRESLAFLIKMLRPSALALISRVFGASTRPYGADAAHFAENESVYLDANSPDVSASLCVERCIDRLATLSSDDAVAALEDLYADGALAEWRELLAAARDRQRDARYRHPDVEHVVHTLQNGPPANSADLAALVTDHLRDLGNTICNGDTNGWQVYWNEENGQQTAPKHETWCRNRLLSDLRQRLRPLGIKADPEVLHANDTRADIRALIADARVPVEIKKDSHPDLWTAIRDQLIANYARGGYGIYLVLWFGRNIKRSPEGRRPRSAEELKEWLERSLTVQERRKISVCVIDVSGKRPVEVDSKLPRQLAS